MASEKAGGTGRGKSKPIERAAGKDAAPSTLVDIDPWGALEKLWEHPEEGEPADGRQGERGTGARRPVAKAKPRRLPRSS